MKEARFGRHLALLLASVSSASLGYCQFRTRDARVALTPSSVEDGVRCQVLKVEERKPVECALVVAESPAVIRRHITNYRPGVMSEAWWGRYEIAEVVPLDDSTTRLVGKIVMWLRTWPVEVVMHEQASDHTFTASWSSAGEAFAVNRGGWTLEEHGARHTFVRYRLDVELPGVPDLVMRNLLLDHLGTVVESVATSMPESD